MLQAPVRVQQPQVFFSDPLGQGQAAPGHQQASEVQGQLTYPGEFFPEQAHLGRQGKARALQEQPQGRVGGCLGHLLQFLQPPLQLLALLENLEDRLGMAPGGTTTGHRLPPPLPAYCRGEDSSRTSSMSWRGVSRSRLRPMTFPAARTVKSANSWR